MIDLMSESWPLIGVRTFIREGTPMINFLPIALRSDLVLNLLGMTAIFMAGDSIGKKCYANLAMSVVIK